MSASLVQQEKNIEGVMRGLMQELTKLAPHPDRPNYNGPLFTQIESQYKPAAEYDGMLGSMMLDGMLGMAFSEVSNSVGLSAAHEAASHADWSNIAEGASQYAQERAQSRSYKLGQRSSISSNFNTTSSNKASMKAYLADLPRRMGIERSLSEYQRKLYAMHKKARETGMLLAA